MRKDKTVYFPDGILTIPLDNQDPVYKAWPSSKEVRNIIEAQTLSKACELARKDDRKVRRFIVHKIKKHFRLI